MSALHCLSAFCVECASTLKCWFVFSVECISALNCWSFFCVKCITKLGSLSVFLCGVYKCIELLIRFAVGSSWVHWNVTENIESSVFMVLTHWGRVTHICVGELTIIGSDNGLSPSRRQAIIWTNAVIVLIRPRGTNFSEILIETDVFSFKKMHLKISYAKWRPSCLGLNVLKLYSSKRTAICIMHIKEKHIRSSTTIGIWRVMTVLLNLTFMLTLCVFTYIKN